MKVLHLTLKKKWFDMIASGAKKEEYREVKPYWNQRLHTESFDVIEFRNGYGKHVPSVTVELLGIERGLGVVEWGAPEKEVVYILKLGQILPAGQKQNMEGPAKQQTTGAGAKATLPSFSFNPDGKGEYAGPFHGLGPRFD